MILPEIIRTIEASPDYVLWTANLGNNPICDLTRVSGFTISEDNEHITFYLPQGLFKQIESNLIPGSNINLLLTSIKDFQSYQVKGSYVSHCESSEEDSEFYKVKVKHIIDLMGAMGLDGQAIMGFLLEQPSIAVKMYAKETYVQTPSPGTGNKIDD